MEQQQYGLLQVPLSTAGLRFRLQVTKPYSSVTAQGVILLNCANLVMVILNLVTDPVEYLYKCKARERETQFHELDTITKEAFQKAGYNYEGAISNMHTVPITSTFTIAINRICRQNLDVAYGTPIGIRFEDDNYHLVIVRKVEDGSLEFLDPQAVDQQGNYPLRFTLNTFWNKNPYGSAIKDIFYFVGPTLPLSKVLNAKSDLTKNLMLESRNVSGKGGKHNTRKKGLKSVRRKTIRGSSVTK